MRQVLKEEFLLAPKAGDIGVIRSDNFFAKLQAMYAHRFKEGPYAASHGFMVKAPPAITEANGITISEATFLKDVGDKTECRFFRYHAITPEQIQKMLAYAKGAEQTGGHYSVGGIFQFAKAFLTGKRNEKNEGGVFCTEYTGDLILDAGLPYITEIPTWQIDPTYQLNWFLSAGQLVGWDLVAHYDGKGGYFVA